MHTLTKKKDEREFCFCLIGQIVIDSYSVLGYKDWIIAVKSVRFENQRFIVESAGASGFNDEEFMKFNIEAFVL